jgi:hypothetical protein
MFCPNCGAEGRSDQTYCRACGLKLDAITQIVTEQKPTAEYAALQRRKERFERLGTFSLGLFAFLAVALVFGLATYYKLHWFGVNVIFGAAFVAMFVFGLLSVFFFNYPKVFMKMDKVNPRLAEPPSPSSPLDNELPPATTAKLIEDRPFEPVPSVAEHTTDLLPVERK